MKRIHFVITLAIITIAITALPSSHALSATNFTLDKSSYNPGDSGTAKVTVYNDQQNLIRITSVDISFNYYYQDGRVYSQDFISPALSMNVSSSTSSQPISVQFNLPSTIAVGYFTPSISVSFQSLNGGTFSNDRQGNLAGSTSLLVSSTSSSQTLMYVFVATTILFAAIAAYFAFKTTANRPQNK